MSSNTIAMHYFPLDTKKRDSLRNDISNLVKEQKESVLKDVIKIINSKKLWNMRELMSKILVLFASTTITQSVNCKVKFDMGWIAGRVPVIFIIDKDKKTC